MDGLKNKVKSTKTTKKRKAVEIKKKVGLLIG